MILSLIANVDIKKSVVSDILTTFIKVMRVKVNLCLYLSTRTQQQITSIVIHGSMIFNFNSICSTVLHSVQFIASCTNVLTGQSSAPWNQTEKENRRL